jgi:hypothetical protein
MHLKDLQCPVVLTNSEFNQQEKFNNRNNNICMSLGNYKLLSSSESQNT